MIIASFFKFVLRLARRLFLLVGILALIAVVAILLIGFTATGNQFAANQLASLISTPDMQLEFEKTEGLLAGTLRVERITVSDTKGRFAEIRNAEIDWSPLTLLKGRFHAERIAAASVALDRMPVTTLEPDPSASAMSLPIEVEVDAIDLPGLWLGKPVLGKDVRLALRGSAKAAADTIALALNLRQSDRSDATATARITYGIQEGSLLLDGQVTEPKGGMIATLLKLPNAPAVNIAVKGDGPINNWQGTIRATLDGVETLVVDARHQATQAGVHDVKITGGGAVGDLLPPALRASFAGQTQIDIDARFDGDGMIDISAGTVANASLTLVAKGRIDPRGEAALSGELTAAKDIIDFRWPLEQGELQARIAHAAFSVAGPFKSARVEFSAALAGVALPQGQAEDILLTASSEAFDLSTRTGKIRTELAVETTQFVDPQVDRLVSGPLKLATTITLDTDQIAAGESEIQSAALGGTFAGSYVFATKAVQSEFKLFFLPDSVLPTEYAAKVKDTIGLSGMVTGTLPGTFAFDNLAVTSNLINGKASGTFADDLLVAKVSGNLLDLSAFQPNATGKAHFELDLSGPVKALAIKANLTAEEAVLAGRALKNLDVKIDGVADPAQPSGKITASGKLDDQTIDVTADLVSADGAVSIPAIKATIGTNTLSGAMTLSPDFLPSGSVVFAFPDIGLLAALAGQKAAGDLAGQADLTSADGKISGTIKASGASIAADAVKIVKPAVDLSIADLLKGQISGTVTAEQFASGQNRLAKLDARFALSAGKTDFDIKSIYDGAPLTTKGSVATLANGLEISLASFAAAPKKIPVKLMAPAVITLVDGTAKLTTLSISAGKGAVTVSGSAGKALDLAIKISALPASLANTFAAGLDAAGTISGSATVKGDPANPAIGFDINWQAAATSQTRGAGLQPFALLAKGQMAKNVLTLNATMKNGDGLSVATKGTVGLTGAIPLALTVTGQLPFSALAGQLAPQGLVLKGNASFDIAVKGSAANPSISGKITTAGGQFIAVRQNLIVNDLAASISLTGKQATISSLSGTLSSGGSISATGTVGITPGSGLPADLKITLKNAVYADGKIVAAKLTGDLTVTGKLQQSPVLGGTIRVGRADITVPEKLPAGLSQINVQHKNAPKDVVAQNKEVRAKPGSDKQGENAGGIAINLRIRAPRQIFVRGRGLDAELGGDVTITGNSANPSVAGGFKMVRGRLNIIGKTLDFSSGTITFGGGMMPSLNMVASTRVSATTINVTVSGLASNPAFAFTSSPTLPQDEVLAQLIFGRTSSSLSPFQIAQLADAAATLAGGQSSSLFNKLRQGLGVDDLNVGTDENGKTNVSAGKYLNKRTYLELKQGTDKSSTKAVINLDIGKGVKLRGEAGTDGSNAAGVFYEKEY